MVMGVPSENELFKYLQEEKAAEVAHAQRIQDMKDALKKRTSSEIEDYWKKRGLAPGDRFDVFFLERNGTPRRITAEVAMSTLPGMTEPYVRLVEIQLSGQDARQTLTNEEQSRIALR